MLAKIVCLQRFPLGRREVVSKLVQRKRHPGKTPSAEERWGQGKNLERPWTCGDRPKARPQCLTPLGRAHCRHDTTGAEDVSAQPHQQPSSDLHRTTENRPNIWRETNTGQSAANQPGTVSHTDVLISHPSRGACFLSTLDQYLHQPQQFLRHFEGVAAQIVRGWWSGKTVTGRQGASGLRFRGQIRSVDSQWSMFVLSPVLYQETLL